MTNEPRKELSGVLFTGFTKERISKAGSAYESCGGEALINGQTYEIMGFKKTSKNSGKEFFNLVFKLKDMTKDFVNTSKADDEIDLSQIPF